MRTPASRQAIQPDVGPEPVRAPLVAIAGRPNAGKSTLFNRLAGGALSITSSQPGTTRDWLEAGVTVEGRTLRLADSAGWKAGGALGAAMDAGLRRGLEAADAILYVAAADAAPHPDDLELTAFLRALGKPVQLVCNKCDSAADDPAAWEHSRLGLGAPLPVSAARSRGFAELRMRLAGLATREAQPDPPAAARAVILGQPNVGKSSLFNALLQAERSLVHDLPGTTRDPVRAPARLAGTAWELVDTAGVERHGRLAEAVYRDAQRRSLASLESADVCVLVMDLTVPLVRHDLRLARATIDDGAALGVALNKADLLTAKDRTRVVAEAMPFLNDRFPGIGRFPVLLTSATAGDGVDALRNALADLHRVRRTRISAADLAEAAHDWPTAGRAWGVRQEGVAPPAFVVMPPPHTKADPRFVMNRLRDRFGLHGVPIRVRWGGRRRAT